MILFPPRAGGLALTFPCSWKSKQKSRRCVCCFGSLCFGLACACRTIRCEKRGERRFSGLALEAYLTTSCFLREEGLVDLRRVQLSVASYQLPVTRLGGEEGLVDLRRDQLPAQSVGSWFLVLKSKLGGVLVLMLILVYQNDKTQNSANH